MKNLIEKVDAINVSQLYHRSYHHRFLQIHKTTLNEGEQSEYKQSNKRLISDYSIQLDQILKLIHSDIKIQQCYECGKTFTCVN